MAKRGRPRKFKLGEIVTSTLTQGLFVVVDHQLRGTKAEYRVVPLSGGRQRYGRAAWVNTAFLQTAGEYSSTGSLVTYRANEYLQAELPEGRGCACQCCIHEAQPRSGFSIHTGDFKE